MVRKLALALSAVFALCGSAGAATYQLATDGTPTGAFVSSGDFLDQFHFTLPNSVDYYNVGGAGTSFSVTFDYGPPFPSLTIPAVTFTSALLKSGNMEFWNATPNGSSFGFTQLGLDAGSYFIEVAGHANSAFGGAYAVSLMAQPVPEPGEWAMMLAGFGLIAAAARRRRRNNA